MGVRCFDVFKCQPYQYLKIGNGNVYGNTVIETRSLLGIFKDRDGMKSSNYVEEYKSDARIHVKPEDYDITTCKELVGDGIEFNGAFYSIVNASAGTNFGTGEIEHYRLDLQLSDLVKEAYNGTQR